MKNLKNLGKALSKAEQQTINGGRRPFEQPDCYTAYESSQCPEGWSFVSSSNLCCYDGGEMNDI